MAGEWNGNGLHGTVKDAEIENQVREKFHQCGKYTQRLQTKKMEEKKFLSSRSMLWFLKGNCKRLGSQDCFFIVSVSPDETPVSITVNTLHALLSAPGPFTKKKKKIKVFSSSGFLEQIAPSPVHRSAARTII